MNISINDIQKISIRIKYESLAKLTKELGTAHTAEEVAPILQANLKYLFDFNQYRILFFYEEEEQITFNINRGEATFQRQEGLLYPGEQAVLQRNIAQLYDQAALHSRKAEIHPAFHRPRAQHLCLYPLRTHDRQYMLLAASNLENKAPSDSDYRFLRLVGEFLISKLSQLILKSKLEHLVEKRTQQLNVVNHEIATLFYRTSHDLTAPFNTLSGLVDLCRMNRHNPDELSNLLDHTDYVIQRAQRMMLKLKIISETETLANGVSSINLPLFLQQIIQRHTAEAATQGIIVSYDLSADREVVFNADILSALLDNVIENAIRYHRASSRPYVKIEIGATPELLTLTVEDNGSGIATEYKKDIFNMYTRFDERSKGNGLGLYLVKKISEKLRGNVVVTSNRNQGTTITIALPVFTH